VRGKELELGKERVPGKVLVLVLVLEPEKGPEHLRHRR
jgi:hypothetical protein